MEKYKAIDESYRKELEEAFFTTMVEKYRKEYQEDNSYQYEVKMQNIKFCTKMTDDELKTSIGLSLDILEELKEINNNGVDRETFQKMEEETRSSIESDVIQSLSLWNKIKTEDLMEALARASQNGIHNMTYQVLLSNPLFIEVIIAVYKTIVDRFEEIDLYEASGFLLLKAIMRMRGCDL